MRDRVGRVRGNLPDDVEEPITAKTEADAQPVFWLALSSDNHSMMEISEIADRMVKDPLQTVDGVANVMLFGDRRFAMRIWLDPSRMAAYQIIPQDIEAALSSQNVEIPAGRIESNQREFSVLSQTDLNSVEQFENIIIRNENSYPVRIKDVARVEIAPEDERKKSRFKGKSAVALGVVKQSTSNPLDVSNGIQERLPQIKAALPEGVNVEIAYDSSIFISESIKSVFQTIFEASILVIAVIFFFLLNPVIGKAQVNWVAEPGWSLWAAALPSIWQNLGLAFVIVLAGLQAVPDEVMEAATLDGYGPIRKLFKITLPLISPVLLFLLVVLVIFGVQAVAQIEIITEGEIFGEKPEEQARVRLLENMVRDRFEAADLRLSIDLGEAGTSFLADGHRLTQILFNLLSNAANFAPAGSAVGVRAWRRDGMISFEVTDDGPGIATNQVEKIFERFEADPSGGRQSGAGLGLSIVKSFVELHHGHVEVRSTPGSGTAVICHFPLGNLPPDEGSGSSERFWDAAE